MGAYDVKRITHRKGVLHIETPLGIVNITVGLTDRTGRQVEAVEMIPNRFINEPMVRVRGNRFVQLKRNRTEKDWP